MLVEVSTGSRLHFGLMELSADQPLRFAGLGLMVSRPAMRLQMAGRPIKSEPSLQVPAALAAKVRQVIERRRRLALDSVFPEQVLLPESLPLHHGLGGGTQLACAVALGLEIFDQQHRASNHAFDRWQSADEAVVGGASGCRLDLARESLCQDSLERWLIQYSGRGLRSAIGLAGFLSGGLILDFGLTQTCTRAESSQVARTSVRSSEHATIVSPKYADERQAIRPMKTLSKRLAASWRIVIIRPQAKCLISGATEARLLGALTDCQNSSREQMFEHASRALDSGGQPQCFDDFAEHLSAYLALAGTMFSKHQGGLYNGSEVAAVVGCAQASGLKAVGQSSWGPTVFGFCSSQAAAEQAVLRIQQQCRIPIVEIGVAKPLSHGARFRITE